jgi:hypothetical protein
LSTLKNITKNVCLLGTNKYDKYMRFKKNKTQRVFNKVFNNEKIELLLWFC